MLSLFPNIWTLPPFQWNYYSSSYWTLSCILISRHDNVLVLWAFISFALPTD